jgi:hypothetical protein
MKNYYIVTKLLGVNLILLIFITGCSSISSPPKTKSLKKSYSNTSESLTNKELNIGSKDIEIFTDSKGDVNIPLPLNKFGLVEVENQYKTMIVTYALDMNIKEAYTFFKTQLPVYGWVLWGDTTNFKNLCFNKIESSSVSKYRMLQISLCQYSDTPVVTSAVFFITSP